MRWNLTKEDSSPCIPGKNITVILNLEGCMIIANIELLRSKENQRSRKRACYCRLQHAKIKVIRLVVIPGLNFSQS